MTSHSWIWVSLCALWILSGCGEPLVAAHYRGHALFSVSGSVQPAPEYDDSQFVCSDEEWVCVDQCYLSHETTEEFDDIDYETEALDQCLDECARAVEPCLERSHSDASFNEVYYGSISQQRIAILWANPVHVGRMDSTPQALLQQRSVTATEFPARYTFSVYQPPPENAYFGEGDQRYAFGIIVTYYDRDGDETLDVAREPVIGFTAESGVLYTPQTIGGDDGARLEKGYHLYTGLTECADADFLRFESPEEAEDSTPLVISGTTSFLFNNLPDVGCDGSHEEWLDLCQSASQRARCEHSATSELYAPICDFCARRSPGLMTEMELPPPAGGMPLEPEPDPEEDDACTADDPIEAQLCEANTEHERCREDAQSPEDEAACDEVLEERRRDIEGEQEPPESP